MRLKLRPMLPRDPNEHERAATQLELFFDLVSVIAIAAITASFHHAISAGHGLDALPSFLFMFFAIWLAWMNYTWFASGFDNDDVLYRVLTILIMAGALIFAGGASYIFETFDFSYGIIGWIIMRLGLILLWVRVATNCPEYRNVAVRFSSGFFLAQLLWIAVYLFAKNGSNLFFALVLLACLFELAVPLWAMRDDRVVPVHRSHIMERHGLLNIIVLGEVLLSVSITISKFYQGKLSLDLAILAISGLVIVFALWWTYFIEDEHLVSGRTQNTFVWGYAHVFIFGSGAALGAGLAAIVDVQTHHSEITMGVAMRYLGVPIAVYLLGLWLARDRYHDLGYRALSLPAAAVIILIATFLGVPVWGLALLVVATLIWRAETA